MGLNGPLDFKSRASSVPPLALPWYARRTRAARILYTLLQPMTAETSGRSTPGEQRVPAAASTP